MQTIWKYPITGTGKITLQMPINAQILSFQNQREVATLWALVNPNNPVLPRTFYLIGTGHEAPENIEDWSFIGTVQFERGMFVYHLFEP